MTREDYYAHPGMNQTRLKKLLISEKEFMAEPGGASPSMALGTLAHSMILEPENEVIIYHGTRRGAKWESFKEENADKIICIQSEYDKSIGIVKSLEKCKLLNSAMEGDYTIESLHLWDEGGIPAKAMMDIVNHDQKIIVDIKTSRDIILEKFQSASFRYGYHIQDDWYRRALGYEYDMYFVCVQSVAPYDFAVFQIDEELREYSRVEVDELLLRVPKVLAKNAEDIQGMYPNNGEPMMITFPNWALHDIYGDENENLELNWE